jgi:hypothetical protein
VSRKGAKHKRPAKCARTQDASAATVSVLPMELQVGDRFTDQDFEWEVVTRPEVLHGAKTLRARIQRPAGGMEGVRADVDLLLCEYDFSSRQLDDANDSITIEAKRVE